MFCCLSIYASSASGFFTSGGSNIRFREFQLFFVCFVAFPLMQVRPQAVFVDGSRTKPHNHASYGLTLEGYHIVAVVCLDSSACPVCHLVCRSICLSAQTMQNGMDICNSEHIEQEANHSLGHRGRAVALSKCNAQTMPTRHEKHLNGHQSG